MRKLLGLLFCFLMINSAVLAKDMRFAQVTDVRYSKANADTLEKVINEINKQKEIEFVVFTGDNINHPDSEDLEAFLAEAKKLHCPFYVVIGDRDVNKRKELSKKQYAKFVKEHVKKHKYSTPNYVFEKKGLVFIVPDGAKDVIPSTTGYYRDEVVDWIDANLDLHKKKKVVILQHFPIVPPAQKETYYTFKAENYLNMLKNHKNVMAVIAGHFGVNKEEIKDGITHISTAPAPTYRVIDIMNYETDAPSVWAQVKVAQ